MIVGRTSIAFVCLAWSGCAGDPAPHPAPPPVVARPPRDAAAATKAYGAALVREAEDPRAALAELDKAIAADPEHVLARLHAAELRLSLGEELARADRDLGPALKLAPDNARAHLRAGQIAQQLGDLPRAQTFLSQATKLKPDWDEPQYELADVWLRMGRAEDAVTAGRKAVELAPDRLELTMRLVGVLEGAGRPADAAKEMEAAATRIGKSAPLFRRAAELFDAAQLHEDAVRLRKVADKIDPPPVVPKKRELPPARKR